MARVILWDKTAQRSLALPNINVIRELVGIHRNLGEDVPDDPIGSRRVLYINRDNVIAMLVKEDLGRNP